jgi:glucose/arabinose dehydrogenase
MSFTQVASAAAPDVGEVQVAAAPTAPKNLTASKITQTTADLAWSASSSSVGIAGYDIYHDGQFIKAVGKSTLKTTMTGLTPNTTYGFYVNARDTAGAVSQASNTVTVTTQKSGDVTPPSPPANLHVTGTTANTVSLAWTASTDPDSPVTGYTILSAGKQAGTSTTNSATIQGLAPDTDYPFQVTAHDAAANTSKPSNSVTARTQPGGGGGGSTPGQVTQVATDNDVPWGLAFLPDGTALYNQRDTQNLIHITAGGQKTTVAKVPGVQGTNGEGGLLGLEISPTYATDHWIYIYHTTGTDNRIVRFKYAANKLDAASEQILVKGLARNKFHNGGRLRFGPDGKLYAGTGDAQNNANAQNKNSLNGKILRINPDGSIPSDNPFGNAVWSYGHRNVQGLAFDSRGRLWESELGNSQWDELNLIQKGGNYGWPGCEGTSGNCSGAGLIAPIREWPVAQASPSGLAIVNDTLFMAAMRGTRLWVMKINGNATSTPVAYFTGTYGRLRTVEPSPDGGLWLTTTNNDKGGTPGQLSNKILHVALN